MDGITIARASARDCKELAELKRQVWNTTYRGIYPDEKIDGYDPAEHEAKFRRMLDGGEQELFAVRNGPTLIGYFSFGKILRPFRHYTHDIGLLYLLKGCQGRGIGTEMFSFAKERLSEAGVTEFIISCNKYNLPAQEFYKKHGGMIVHTAPDNRDCSIPQVKFLFKTI